MSSAVLEQPAVTDMPGLPNKFLYPEFAGFSGEQLMHDIARAMLPFALYRTWEIFESKHAYDNDCFLSLAKVAERARRTSRTVERNLATLASRGLMTFRSEVKFFRDPDGTTRKRVVMVKDFSGLYALAHEYFLWQYSEDYQAPDWEGTELIRHNARLVAKLCRFEDYRRALEQQRDPLFLRVQADPRFILEEEPDQQHAEGVEMQKSRTDTTKMVSNMASEVVSKVSKERINEKAYRDCLGGDSFDSAGNRERGGEASAPSTAYSQEQASRARDYTKPGRGDETHLRPSILPPATESTNLVPLSSLTISPAPGKTRESAENHPDVWQARRAMAATGDAPERSARRQAEELPPPTKHPLARSFVHEVAGLFGDLNEKGSKTGIERSIEAFELEPADVLLCLVRAYVVARNSKDEKIRHRRPDGAANRMPLFCTMFRKFAQALGPGSRWQYTWEQMLEDIAADDRLSLWLSEHQTELAEDPDQQENRATQENEESRQFPEAHVVEASGDKAGWATNEEAYEQGKRLAQAVADANYGNVEVAVALHEGAGRFSVVFRVLGEGGGEIPLTTDDEVAHLITQAEQGQL